MPCNGRLEADGCASTVLCARRRRRGAAAGVAPPARAAGAALMELHWTGMVADINKVATVGLDLHRHLFGSG
jgi:hypothetical protein